MADTASQVRQVVARLRADGHTVVEVPGWETRGRGPMTTRGRIEHHTATPRRVPGDAPTLRVVTFGHGTLRNSLCRWYVSRTGIIYLVALRTSWHAGRGVKGTNSTLSGTEAEHSGSASEPWSDGSLDAQAAISRSEADVFGFSVGQVWEHREHAPGRKVDRVDINAAAWRRRLAAPTLAPPIPEPPAPSWIEKLMAAGIDVTPLARELGRQADAARAVAEVEVARQVATIRATLDADPDPVSDAIWAGRIASGQRTLQAAAEAIAAKAATDRT